MISRGLLKKLSLLATVFSIIFAKTSIGANSFNTLDNMKSEASSYMSSSPTLIPLESTSSSDSISVKINGVEYFFIPNSDDSAFLKALSKTSAGNLLETTLENALFYDSVDDKYYMFDIASIPNSIYEINESTSADYSFISKEVDANGVLINKYYKVSLKIDELSTSPNLTWEEVSGSGIDVIEVLLPNNETKYLKYTWQNTDPTKSRYTSTQISLSGNVNADFIGSNVAIINYGNINRITGDFIGNNSDMENYFAHEYINEDEGYCKIDAFTDTSGGAIINSGTIKSLEGNFIGNYTSAVNKIQTVITDWEPITYDRLYINVESHAQGGAIYNGYNAKMENIAGNFVGNYAFSNSSTDLRIDSPSIFLNEIMIQNNSYAQGGVIFNNYNATMGNITGDFINNYAKSIVSTSYMLATGGEVYGSGDAEASGGAIYNTGSIGDTTGDFINNYVMAGYFAENGDIYSANGIIGLMVGLFTIATMPL